MPLVQTQEPSLARDTESKALVTTDVVELHRSRVARAASRRLAQQQQVTEERFKTIEDRFENLEGLLSSVVNTMQKIHAALQQPAK